ncbi:cell wall-binding repeat-containing protein, partial [uncultured Finegoldia sp.]|uniref:cell wall-binding repeat-containing protein n=1 Tax=uncultured Finegoldia sp. TaxID=328009 RepID=UPI0026323716
GKIVIPADKVKDGTEVSAIAKDKAGNPSTPTETSKAKAKTPSETDTTAPAAPKVEAKDNGDVTVTPPTDVDTKEVEVTYTPEGQTNPVKVTATKGDDGTWTFNPADSGLKVEEGKIVIPADKVKDGTEVSAVAKDKTGNTSKATDTSKANAKTPASEIKDPASQITVANSKALTDEEKGKVKKAVEDANPNLPKDAKVTVADDGSVTITDKAGKEIGKISSDKTVKQDESKLAVKAPEKVAVKDPENVTPEEQGKIKVAIKKANPDLTDATITVDNKGNVTVEKDGKKGTLSPSQTIKKSGESGEETGLKDPTKVAVKDPVNLTDDEKQAIKDAVKKANPGLTDEQIAVDKEGNVTVTKAGEKAKTIGKDKTVSTDVKAPEVTEVANPSKLTNDEIAKVKDAVKKANTGLTDGQIEVKENGTVVITKDGKETTIPASDVVKKKTTPAVDKSKLQIEVGKESATKASDKFKNADAAKKKAYDEALTKAKEVLAKTNATQEEVNAAKKALKAAEKALNGMESPTVKAPTTPVTVANSKALTEDEKEAVKKAVKDENPNLPEGATIDVANDGTVIVKDKDGKLIGTITPEKAVKQDDNKLAVKAPTLVQVVDPDNIKPEEQNKIKEAVKEANPDLNLTDDDITVDVQGNVTVTKDGKTGTLTPAQTVVKSGEVNTSQLEDELSKEDAIKESDKYKNADKDKKDSYDESVDKGKKVVNDKATQEDVNKAKEALEKAADELNGKATDKSELQAEVDKENTTKASDKYKYAYADKKNAYDNALANAKNVLNNLKASQAEVDAALNALQKAELALKGKKPGNGGTTPSYPSYPSYPSNTQTPGTTTENRVSGNDRIQTAIEISKKYFGHADTVIVVDSNNYADAITASVLSKILKAPILLTDTHKLDTRVGAEIERLGAKDVIIVGGHNSVADSVKGELKAYDENSVERIWGNDRYETSAQVARRIVQITGKKGHAVIASGEVFADALAVGPYAAQQGYPILLVQAKNIPTTINKALKDLGIENVTIAGGLNTVSKSLESPLPNVVERLQGNSRYETAIAIANAKFPSTKEAFLVNGENWMDALVIAPVGGIMSKPILLTPSNNAPQSLKDYLLKSQIERLTAVGGNRMVSEQVLKELTKK